MKIVNLNRIKEKANDYIDDYFVLKANAYGLGFYKILDYLYLLGKRRFAVLSLDDAVYIKSHYPDCYALLLGVFDYKQIGIIKKYKIIPSLCHLQDFFRIENIDAEIKINTGMNRFGIDLLDIPFVIELSKKRGINILAAYSHIASFDSYQVQKHHMDYASSFFPNIHFESSRFKKSEYRKRIGMEIYQNALSVFATIIESRYVKKGSILGYDAIADKDMWVGIIGYGYDNGICKSFVGTNVYVDGCYQKVLSVCMNHSFISLDSNLIGHKVELFGEHINISSKNCIGISNYEFFVMWRNMEIIYLS